MYLFAVLRTKPRAFHIPGKRSTTEPNPSPLLLLLKCLCLGPQGLSCFLPASGHSFLAPFATCSSPPVQMSPQDSCHGHSTCTQLLSYHPILWLSMPSSADVSKTCISSHDLLTTLSDVSNWLLHTRTWTYFPKASPPDTSLRQPWIPTTKPCLPLPGHSAHPENPLSPSLGFITSLNSQLATTVGITSKNPNPCFCF